MGEAMRNAGRRHRVDGVAGIGCGDGKGMNIDTKVNNVAYKGKKMNNGEHDGKKDE